MDARVGQFVQGLPTLEEIDYFTKKTVTKSVEDYLNNISYEVDPDYVPSDFALEFINFIKLVNGAKGEENTTPVVHYQMLDKISEHESNVCNMCARGIAKTTLLGEYLFLYLAVYGELPDFGKVDYALYVSDSIENGVKKMRFRLERRWENSDFLKHYVPEVKFTDIRWYFKNKAGKEFVVTGHGAKTGVRGTVELNTRPQIAILDDLISDEDARSDVVIKSVEATVYKAINYALHPTRNRIIWSGTPFNAKDPLYKAVESGAWTVNVFPICAEFPVSRAEFKGAWEDRFTYEYVANKYQKALQAGQIDTFNQELMLRIMSEEDRLIQDGEIMWYRRERVMMNKGAFNFYITTDFATTERTSGDYSVISVWAYNNNGDWLWVDGICERQTMDKNIDALFKLVQEYSPQQVGIEISGQQKGFISWIQNEMISRNIYFTLASDKTTNEPGIRPNTNKLQRFNVVVPLFKLHKIWLPEEMKQSKPIAEAINELSLVSVSGFKSKHDDFIDTISMLGLLTAWKPSQVTPEPDKDGKIWDEWAPKDENKSLELYLV
jgi:predicted phage terminase large subunit-like protein